MFDFRGQSEEFRLNHSDMLEFDSAAESFYWSKLLLRIFLYSLTVFEQFTNQIQIPLHGLHFKAMLMTEGRMLPSCSQTH